MKSLNYVCTSINPYVRIYVRENTHWACGKFPPPLESLKLTLDDNNSKNKGTYEYVYWNVTMLSDKINMSSGAN